MSEFKGTKGKWGVEYDFNRALSSHTLKVIGNKENVLHGEMICFIRSCRKNNFSQSCKADAQLIAHAPEMIEALIKVNEFINENSDKNYMVKLLDRELPGLNELIESATNLK